MNLTHYSSKNYYDWIIYFFLRLLAVGIAICTLECAAATEFDEKVPNKYDESWLLNHAEKIPELIAQHEIMQYQIPNPHWRDGTCQTCHIGNPKDKPVKFRSMNPNDICQYCHNAKFEHSYIHPTDIKPDAAMTARMPVSYRKTLTKKDGQMTCLTCHDLYKQCLPKFRIQQGLNPAFFRRGPFRLRSEQCYFCHDSSQYERLNPHEQVTDDGRIRSGTCSVCHSDNLDTLLSNKDPEAFQYYGEQDLKLLCIRCHNVPPHPSVSFLMNKQKGPPNHLVKPNSTVIKRIIKKTREDKLLLPMEPETGKIFCATCHNPHSKGVINNGKVQQIGINPNRLRAGKHKICTYCHSI